MRMKHFNRRFAIVLAILAVVAILIRVGHAVDILSNRHMLYFFEARGVVFQCLPNGRMPSFAIHTSTGDGIKGISFSIPIKRWPPELHPGVTFEKKTQSWLCHIDGQEVDLSGVLPRF